MLGRVCNHKRARAGCLHFLSPPEGASLSSFVKFLCRAGDVCRVLISLASVSWPWLVCSTRWLGRTKFGGVSGFALSSNDPRRRVRRSEQEGASAVSGVVAGRGYVEEAEWRGGDSGGGGSRPLECKYYSGMMWPGGWCSRGVGTLSRTYMLIV